MKVTLTSNTGGVFSLEVGAELTVRDLQALAEIETGIEQSEMLLVHNMAPLLDPLRMLGDCGLEEGDVIVVSRIEGGVRMSDSHVSKCKHALNLISFD